MPLLCQGRSWGPGGGRGLQAVENLDIPTLAMA